MSGSKPFSGIAASYRRSAAILAIVVVGVAFWMLGLSRASDSSSTAQANAPDANQRASFPHGKPKHSTLDCSKCHTISPADIDVKKFPGHAVCVACHNLALESINKPIAFCGICHEQRPGVLITKALPALFQFPKPDVTKQFGDAFSHPTHMKPDAGRDVLANKAVAKQGLDGMGRRDFGPPPKCSDCHHTLVPPMTPEVSSDTGHKACFQCHNQQPLAKPSMYQCAECHKLAGPRSPHLYGVVTDFKHSDHDYDIRSKKKADLRIPKPPDYLCAECHQSAASAAGLGAIRLPQESYCNDCHNGKIGLPDPLSQKVLDSLKSR